MRQGEGEWVKIHEGLLCLIQLQMKSVCSVNSICLRRRLVDVVITPPPTAFLPLHLPLSLSGCASFLVPGYGYAATAAPRVSGSG